MLQIFEIHLPWTYWLIFSRNGWNINKEKSFVSIAGMTHSIFFLYSIHGRPLSDGWSNGCNIKFVMKSYTHKITKFFFIHF